MGQPGDRWWAEELNVDPEGSSLRVQGSGGEDLSLRVPVHGIPIITDLLCAWAIAAEIGVTVPVLVERAAHLKGAPHRLEVSRVGGITIIDDAYNSNPDGAAEALRLLADLPGQRRVLVTPGFIELGPLQEQSMRELGRRAAAVCTHVILVGPRPAAVAYMRLREAGYPSLQLTVAKNLEEAQRRLPPGGGGRRRGSLRERPARLIHGVRLSLQEVTVAVVFGSRSVEHEISVITACQAMPVLRDLGAEVVPVYITKDGRWLTKPDFIDLGTFRRQLPGEGASIQVDLDRGRLLAGGYSRLGRPRDLGVDVIYPCLHGTLGEDGTLAALAEMARIPQVGSSTLASSLAMDKYLSKKVFEACGLPVVAGRTSNSLEGAREAASGFGYPLVVKPNRSGNIGGRPGQRRR